MDVRPLARRARPRRAGGAPALASLPCHGLAGTRITVAFLDDDPLEVADRIGPALDPLDDLAYAGPFEAIVPWRWGWFDDGG